MPQNKPFHLVVKEEFITARVKMIQRYACSIMSGLMADKDFTDWTAESTDVDDDYKRWAKIAFQIARYMIEEQVEYADELDKQWEGLAKNNPSENVYTVIEKIRKELSGGAAKHWYKIIEEDVLPLVNKLPGLVYEEVQRHLKEDN